MDDNKKPGPLKKGAKTMEPTQFPRWSHGVLSDPLVTEKPSGNVFPVDMTPQDKRILEEAGVKFGEWIWGDEKLSYRVQLPPGWKEVETKHTLWLDIVDAQGNVRAMIFPRQGSLVVPGGGLGDDLGIKA